MSKEDIWVCRIPLPSSQSSLPIKNELNDASVGPLVAGWNTYAPKWCKVDIARSPVSTGQCLRLQDSDPYDYARAIRIFGPTANVNLSFEVYVEAAANDNETFEIELLSEFKSLRPVRIILKQGSVTIQTGELTPTVGHYEVNRWVHFSRSGRTFPSAEACPPCDIGQAGARIH
jgi:hypothetical protein